MPNKKAIERRQQQFQNKTRNPRRHAKSTPLTQRRDGLNRNLIRNYSNTTEITNFYTLRNFIIRK